MVDGSPRKPPRERVSRERGRCSPPIDAEDSLVDPTSDATLRGQIRQRGERAAPLRQCMDVADRARAKRRSVPPEIAGEEFALEPRDVDADGTFRFARPAL